MAGRGDPVAAAQDLCLRLLSARSRSRAELADAMRRKGILDETAAAVLDRYVDVGLVDDDAFAAAAVRSGHAHRGLGQRALRAELRRKGVADDVAQQAVAAIGPENEEQRARELVRRKLRTATARDDVALVRRLAGMLARKGYSEGMALRVVREELGAAGGEWPDQGE
ncbi:MAG: regulatory protein RecX [Pseudonocardiaceae bacterium]|nr:regulatory protein RecX [Pseudonocardiaceae bacterium]